MSRHDRARLVRSLIDNRYGYHILVVLTLLSIVAQPWGGTTGFDNWIFRFANALVFSVALLAISTHRNVRLFGLGLLIPAVTLGIFVPDDLVWVHVIEATFALAFVLLMSGAMLRRIFQHDRVDAATISGAVCVYLFLGVAFAFGYLIVATLDPGALTIAPVGSTAENISTFYYFSFTTLTTLGYGDIAPLSEPARSLAILEAIVGQLYLVVLVARFVGIHAGRGSRVTYDVPPAGQEPS